MNYKSNDKFLFGIVAAMLTATITFTLATTAFATSDPQSNDFGEGASHLGTTDQMGEHSSEQNEPRAGIGNVFDQGDPKDDPDSKHPADTANRLCPEGSTDPRCPPSD
jgi:Spy/CpxP family protein refolding chaperone